MGYYIEEGHVEAGWWWVMHPNGSIQSGPYNHKDAQKECDELN